MIRWLATALCALALVVPRCAEAMPPEDAAATASGEPSPSPSVAPTPHVWSFKLPEGLPRAQLYWYRGGGYRFLDETTVK